MNATDVKRMRHLACTKLLPCTFCVGEAVVVKARWERNSWIAKCSHFSAP